MEGNCKQLLHAKEGPHECAKSNEVSFFMKYTSFRAVSSKYVRNKLT